MKKVIGVLLITFILLNSMKNWPKYLHFRNNSSKYPKMKVATKIFIVRAVWQCVFPFSKMNTTNFLRRNARSADVMNWSHEFDTSFTAVHIASIKDDTVHSITWSYSHVRSRHIRRYIMLSLIYASNGCVHLTIYSVRK